LVEKYDSVAQFREKFVRQLASAVMKLTAADTSSAGRPHPPGVHLQAAFIAGKPLRIVDEENPLILDRIVCVDEMEIPEYFGIDRGQLGTEFYRRVVRYRTDESSIACVWLAVTDKGDTVVRDIHMEMTARVTSGNVNVRMTQPYTPSGLKSNFGAMALATVRGTKLAIGQQNGDEWPMQLDLPVVQAGRIIAARETLPVQVMDDASVTVTATVYSSAGRPFTVEVPLHLRVELHEMTYLDILDEFEPAAAAELRQMNGEVQS
jgi:hypothetical protein